MPFQITTTEDEQLFQLYTQHRNEVRNVMGYGVYPNLMKALETYAAFDAALANQLNDPDLLEYHASIMSQVAPYIGQLRQLAQGMTQIMVAIETAQPGAFGITLPAPPPPPPEKPDEPDKPDMPLKIITTESVGLTPPSDPQTILHIETEKPE